MKEEFEILDQLTAKQRLEFDNDIQQLYLECHKQLNGKLEKLKDVTVNLNLNNEVFLNVVCEYDSKSNDNVKGRITQLHQYATKKEYDIAVSVERASLN